MYRPWLTQRSPADKPQIVAPRHAKTYLKGIVTKGTKRPAAKSKL